MKKLFKTKLKKLFKNRRLLKIKKNIGDAMSVVTRQNIKETVSKMLVYALVTSSASARSHSPVDQHLAIISAAASSSLINPKKIFCHFLGEAVTTQTTTLLTLMVINILFDIYQNRSDDFTELSTRCFVSVSVALVTSFVLNQVFIIKALGCMIHFIILMIELSKDERIWSTDILLEPCIASLPIGIATLRAYSMLDISFPAVIFAHLMYPIYNLYFKNLFTEQKQERKSTKQTSAVPPKTTPVTTTTTPKAPSSQQTTTITTPTTTPKAPSSQQTTTIIFDIAPAVGISQSRTDLIKPQCAFGNDVIAYKNQDAISTVKYIIQYMGHMNHDLIIALLLTASYEGEFKNEVKQALLLIATGIRPNKLEELINKIEALQQSEFTKYTTKVFNRHVSLFDQTECHQELLRYALFSNREEILECLNRWLILELADQKQTITALLKAAMWMLQDRKIIGLQDSEAISLLHQKLGEKNRLIDQFEDVARALTNIVAVTTLPRGSCSSVPAHENLRQLANIILNTPLALDKSLAPKSLVPSLSLLATFGIGHFIRNLKDVGDSLTGSIKAEELLKKLSDLCTQAAMMATILQAINANNLYDVGLPLLLSAYCMYTIRNKTDATGFAFYVMTYIQFGIIVFLANQEYAKVSKLLDPSSTTFKVINNYLLLIINTAIVKSGIVILPFALTPARFNSLAEKMTNLTLSTTDNKYPISDKAKELFNSFAEKITPYMMISIIMIISTCINLRGSISEKTQMQDILQRALFLSMIFIQLEYFNRLKKAFSHVSFASLQRDDFIISYEKITYLISLTLLAFSSNFFSNLNNLNFAVICQNSILIALQGNSDVVTAMNLSALSGDMIATILFALIAPFYASENLTLETTLAMYSTPILGAVLAHYEQQYSSIGVGLAARIMLLFLSIGTKQLLVSLRSVNKEVKQGIFTFMSLLIFIALAIGDEFTKLPYLSSFMLWRLIIHLMPSSFKIRSMIISATTRPSRTIAVRVGTVFFEEQPTINNFIESFQMVPIKPLKSVFDLKDLKREYSEVGLRGLIIPHLPESRQEIITAVTELKLNQIANFIGRFLNLFNSEASGRIDTVNQQFLGTQNLTTKNAIKQLIHFFESNLTVFSLYWFLSQDYKQNKIYISTMCYLVSMMLYLAVANLDYIHKLSFVFWQSEQYKKTTILSGMLLTTLTIVCFSDLMISKNTSSKGLDSTGSLFVLAPYVFISFIALLRFEKFRQLINYCFIWPITICVKQYIKPYFYSSLSKIAETLLSRISENVPVTLLSRISENVPVSLIPNATGAEYIIVSPNQDIVHWTISPALSLMQALTGYFFLQGLFSGSFLQRLWALRIFLSISDFTSSWVTPILNATFRNLLQHRHDIIQKLHNEQKESIKFIHPLAILKLTSIVSFILHVTMSKDSRDKDLIMMYLFASVFMLSMIFASKETRSNTAYIIDTTKDSLKLLTQMYFSLIFISIQGTAEGFKLLRQNERVQDARHRVGKFASNSISGAGTYVKKKATNANDAVSRTAERVQDAATDAALLARLYAFAVYTLVFEGLKDTALELRGDTLMLGSLLRTAAVETQRMPYLAVKAGARAGKFASNFGEDTLIAGQDIFVDAVSMLESASNAVNNTVKQGVLSTSLALEATQCAAVFAAKSAKDASIKRATNAGTYVKSKAKDAKNAVSRTAKRVQDAAADAALVATLPLIAVCISLFEGQRLVGDLRETAVFRLKQFQDALILIFGIPLLITLITKAGIKKVTKEAIGRTTAGIKRAGNALALDIVNPIKILWSLQSQTRNIEQKTSVKKKQDKTKKTDRLKD